jgi:hypothetical protein
MPLSEHEQRQLEEIERAWMIRHGGAGHGIRVVPIKR